MWQIYTLDNSLTGFPSVSNNSEIWYYKFFMYTKIGGVMYLTHLKDHEAHDIDD